MKFIKQLLKENKPSAVIFGIIGTIYAIPIIIAFLLFKYIVEKPITYIINKFKNGKKDKNKKTKVKAKAKKKNKA